MSRIDLNEFWCSYPVFMSLSVSPRNAWTAILLRSPRFVLKRRWRIHEEFYRLSGRRLRRREPSILPVSVHSFDEECSSSSKKPRLRSKTEKYLLASEPVKNIQHVSIG